MDERGLGTQYTFVHCEYTDYPNDSNILLVRYAVHQ